MYMNSEIVAIEKKAGMSFDSRGLKHLCVGAYGHCYCLCRKSRTSLDNSRKYLLLMVPLPRRANLPWCRQTAPSLANQQPEPQPGGFGRGNLYAQPSKRLPLKHLDHCMDLITKGWKLRRWLTIPWPGFGEAWEHIVTSLLPGHTERWTLPQAGICQRSCHALTTSELCRIQRCRVTGPHSFRERLSGKAEV